METDQKYNKVLEELDGTREENATLQNELQNLKIQFHELEETNNHLIAATWRERDLKKKLTDTIGELNRTKLVVENQNKRITESINYARKIQLAINPTEADLQTCLPESFILYLPKDMISGDFPWLFQHGDFIYVAAVDCTGHGVPGAMMSMIGNLLLNDITNGSDIMLPSQILNHLHAAVVQTLKQNVQDNNSSDGMDIGLSRINIKTREIVYSGAHRPLFLLRDEEIIVHSGDKFPIGGMHYKGLNSFTDTQFQFQANDRIFLFTDGFPDQIGSTGKKLMTRNLKLFIESNCKGPMEETRTKLYDFFLEWKGDQKQIDDILIMGVKF
ncbi:hypothetical protein CNR22_23035 [Sphingobacteriaceae bacterium]|nr:hypothetical protein CNR22_23035 [Sphingobacteriaceae bacterium]